MSPPAENLVGIGDSLWPTASISSNVLRAAIIFFFILLLLFVVLNLCHRLHSRPSRPIFVSPGPVTFLRHGLDAVIPCALPITIFKDDPEEEIKCAVCLCKLSDGEEVRVVPKCNDAFHLKCIDMWFHSHSTCPLCRNPIRLPVPVYQGIPAPEPVTAE